MTPLNAVATSASRLDLPVLQTPASVEIVTQQTMQDQGYRTSAEIAKGAVGVLDLNSSGAPANFSMRGFTFGAVNVLYNGISIGVASDTTRVMDTANLDQVEFLKGPSALMSGIMAIGGSVNYVSKQPTTGPIQNELDLSVDSLGTVRSHYGSGGSTPVGGSRLSLRRDGIEISTASSTVIIAILANLSAQLNYHVNNTLQDVRRHRIQEGFRPGLLGHADGSDLVCRTPRRKRRCLGQHVQHVQRLQSSGR